MNSSEAVEAFKLDNGMQVILWPRGEGSSVATAMTVGAGSRHENEKNYGIAHFLEHIIFQRTDLWDKPGQLERWVEEKGMMHNASTSAARTDYWFRGQSRDIEDLIEYTRQVAFHTNLVKEAVEGERGIISEEFKMYWDRPDGYASFLVNELKFPNHPLGISTLGTLETIQNLSLDQLKEFHQTFYQPNNATFVLVGAFDFKRAKELVQERLILYENKNLPGLDIFQENQKAPRLKFGHRGSEQAIARLDFKVAGISPAYTPDNVINDQFALEVLMTMLADGNACIYENELIDQKALINDYGASLIWDREVSSYQVEYTGQPSKMTQNIAETVRIYNDIKIGKYDDEIVRAKQLYKTQQVFELEENSDRARMLGQHYILTGEIFDIENHLQKIDAVSAEDVQRVAQKYFTASNANLAWVGREEPDMDELKSILRELG